LPLACFILPPPAGGGKSFPEALAEEEDEIYLIALINGSLTGDESISLFFFRQAMKFTFFEVCLHLFPRPPRADSSP